MEWEGTETWQRHTKTSFFLALRIGAEILLSQRGKRLERKPDPKGNAQITNDIKTETTLRRLPIYLINNKILCNT